MNRTEEPLKDCGSGVEWCAHEHKTLSQEEKGPHKWWELLVRRSLSLGLEHPRDLAAVPALARHRLIVVLRVLVAPLLERRMTVAAVRAAGVPAEVVRARCDLAVQPPEVAAFAVARACMPRR